MADDPTLAAVHGVAEDLRGLRVELTGRMDQMVTRREHEAEVKRIDAEAARTRDALAAHQAQEDVRLTAIQAQLTAGDTAILARIEAGEHKREQAQADAAERRRQDRRWTASWAVAAVSATAAVTTVITRLI